MGPTKKELSTDGQKNKGDLYALLSETRHRFSEATAAIIGVPEPHQAQAGFQIFTAALRALQYIPTAGELPTFDLVKFDGSANEAVIPPHILAALGYFKSVPRVCLTELNFQPLHRFDNAFQTYPNSVLRDQEALERFFGDLARVFSREHNPFPILPDPDVRAYQICRYCDRALGRELEIVGEPLHARIFLPRD